MRIFGLGGSEVETPSLGVVAQPSSPPDEKPNARPRISTLPDGTGRLTAFTDAIPHISLASVHLSLLADPHCPYRNLPIAWCGFPSRGTVTVLSWDKSLLWGAAGGGVPVPWTMLSSLLSLHPRDAGSTSPPSCEEQKCLQTSSMSAKEQDCRCLKTTGEEHQLLLEVSFDWLWKPR